MDYLTLFGAVGAGFVLSGFLLSQFTKVTTTSKLYEILNIVGSSILIAYAVLLNSYPFIVLNTVWLLVSLRGLWTAKNSHKLK